MTGGSAEAAPPAGSAIVSETRALLRLGAPLMAAQLATMAITTTDVVMVSLLGPEPLAAIALATSLLHSLFMFGSGVVLACAPMIATAIGARRRRDARRSLRQGLWAAGAMTLFAAPVLLAAEPILIALGQSPEIAALADDYLDGAALAFLPMTGFVALRSFLAAHDETRIVLWVTMTGVLVNAAADWMLIFGELGAPELGLFGAGLATVATHSAMAALLALHLARRPRYRRYALFARFHRADWPRLFAIFRLGAPIGLMLTAEVGMFAGVAMLMGVLGEAELAGHAVAIQLASIAFMVPFGLSHATTARVGLAMGRGDDVGAARASWTSLALTIAFMAAVAILFWSAPNALASLFLASSEPAYALAVSYLGIAALFQIVDGAQVSAAAALRGMGDTRAPMLIAVGGYWAVGLPISWLLGFKTGLDGVGVWLGLAAGLATAAVLLIARLRAQLCRAREDGQRNATLSSGPRRP